MQTVSEGNVSMEVACGLAEEVVRTFGEVRLRVFGISMVPAILPGDVVSVRRASAEEVSVGEAVLYSRGGRLFVHRVVDRTNAATGDRSEEPRLITRGDRMRREDSPVAPSELLGRVVSVERDRRRVEFPVCESNTLVARALRSSERLTSLYLRFAQARLNFFPRRDKCRA